MSEKIALDKIRIDGGTQARAKIDKAVVEEYAAVVNELPASEIFHDGSEYWLADGFHRYHAHLKAGESRMLCFVHAGTQRDAVLFSIAANATHGLRRTRADKHRAVDILLRDDEWSKKSDRWIAEKASVSHSFVAELRKDAEPSKPKRTPEPEEQAGKPAKSSQKPPLKEPKDQVATLPPEISDKPDEVTEPKKRRGRDGKNYPTTDPVKDELGQPVPADLLDVFASRAEYDKALQHFTEMVKITNRLLGDPKDNRPPTPGGLYFSDHRQEFQRLLINARRFVTFGRPYAPCPRKHGSGKCPACRDSGWTTKDIYDNAGVK